MDFSPALSPAAQAIFTGIVLRLGAGCPFPTLVQKAIDQARDYLQVDRLIFYPLQSLASGQAFACPQVPVPTHRPWPPHVYEARSTEPIAPMIGNWNCYYPLQQDESYRQGPVLAVPDVEKAYAHLPYLQDVLRPLQVRAQLVAPVLVQGEVWSLLIAHECQRPRPWSLEEQDFLKCLGNYLAIALRQEHLQTQQQILQQRLQDHTNALQDTLMSAQMAEQTKHDFLATMGHELRTPLTYIIGMSATLLRWPHGQLSEQQRGYVEKIQASGRQLLGLINDILALSQLEAGQASLKLSKFGVTQLAQQALGLFQEEAEAKGVELSLRLRLKVAEDDFTADRRRVERILCNLLSNAIKFTPPGGQATLTIWAEASHLVLEVEDTGIGIPKHQQTDLFKPFQQLEPSHCRQHGGAGLGLALTKRLVELHRGWIEVQSMEGMGSVFTVRLPSQLRPAPKSPSSTNEALSPPGK